MPTPDDKSRSADSKAIPTQVPDHVLIRPIGRGSYGDVWLARNVVGQMRAVKIVWRHKFEHDRPYDREFDGIRRFEPISRSHDCLVDVLHVGRSDAAGCFYYVMELADDSGTDAPLSLVLGAEDIYRAKTLREVHRLRKHLPVQECLAIGAQLAAGLHYLHEEELVHRDIKPSNIIFVKGQPKLADIGLVAGVDEAKSFVGTEGFVAPEGPGTCCADIYSLGKLLYELVTGFDRHDFPKLPAWAGAPGADGDAFAEFNEVVLRACDPDPRRRYQSAEELRAELLLLQGGKSVRQLRGYERRFGMARKISLIAAGAALVATIAYFGSFKQIRRAQQAEKSALENVELLKLQKVDDLFRRDDSSTALALLARVVRDNPTNRVAVERLVSALTWSSFVRPKMEPIQPNSRPQFINFSKDGQKVFVATHAGFLESWDTGSGALIAKKRYTTERIYWLENSPDGKLLAVAGYQFAAIVDPATLKPVVPLLAHPFRATMIHFSPDQQWVVTAGHDHAGRLWRTATGENVGELLTHAGSVRAVAFSPDGKKVATGSRDGSIRLWEVPSSKSLTPFMWHTAIVSHVTFSPDGKLLASASNDYEARLWDTSTGNLLHTLKHDDCVSYADFSPDGTRVVTASEDGSAVVWDTATGRRIGNPLRHRSWVRWAEFAPDGERVVTASEDNTIRLWDSETTLPLTEPMRHPDEVIQARFNDTGTSLAAAVSSTKTAEVWIWDGISDEARSLPLAEASQINKACFSPDGSKIGAGCEDGMIRIWSMDQRYAKPTSIRAGFPVDSVVFSRDNSLLLALTGTNATLWDLKIQKQIGNGLSHAEPINSASFNPDGTMVATASADGTACIWETRNAGHLLELPPAAMKPTGRELGDSDMFTAEFSPDGSQLLTASRNARASLWEVSSGKLISQFQHDHWVLNAEFSPDGREILTASFDRSARIWNATAGSSNSIKLTHDSDILTAHFSKDGRFVVTTSMDWTARVWDARTGLPMADPLRHGGPVRTASFSPDGQSVATGADDGVVRLWDTTTGLALNGGLRHSSPIESLSFSPQGTFLLVVPKKGDLHLYDVLRPTLPAPTWLAELAESVSGQRFGESGKIESTSPRRFFELQQQLKDPSQSGFYAQWAGWFLEDASQRRISPNSRIKIGEYVNRTLSRNVLDDVREAVFLSPTNALAHARLAQHLLTVSPEKNPRHLKQADWHSAHAVQLAPDDKMVLRIRQEVSARIRESRMAQAQP